MLCGLDLKTTNENYRNFRADVSCESKSTCRDCLTLPQCGWSENKRKDGTGRCLKGGARASHDVPNWHFFDCPRKLHSLLKVIIGKSCV